MTDYRFDVIVVGARCAGAALATFLARSGTRDAASALTPQGIRGRRRHHGSVDPGEEPRPRNHGRQRCTVARRISEYKETLKERTLLLEAAGVAAAA